MNYIQLTALLLAGVIVLMLMIPFSSLAAVSTAGDINFKLIINPASVPLDFFNNYTKDGTDRDSPIPYTFRGHTYASFELSRPASAKYNYVSGVISKRVTYSVPDSGASGTSVYSPRPYILDSSLPPGMDVYLTASGSFVDINIYFDNVNLSYAKSGGFTLGLDVAAYADAHNFGNSYSRLNYTLSVSPDWYGSLYFSESADDMDPGARELNDLLTAMSNRLNTGFNTLHTDIATTLVNNLRTWFATNHNDLVTLHNDNTTFLSRFNSFWTDIVTKFTGWFDRQHTDFENLLEQTTEGYDDSSASSVNNSFSGAVSNFDKVESDLNNNASANIDSYDFSSSLNFTTGVLSGLSVVSSFVDAFFRASGEFSSIVGLIYSLAFLVMIIGIWRFRK